jgi:hypothetical protein
MSPGSYVGVGFLRRRSYEEDMKSLLDLSMAAGMGFQQRLTTRICLGGRMN